MSITVEGAEEFGTELERRLEERDGRLQMTEVFTDGFMRTYTDFDSFTAFLEVSPWTVETQSDFESIPGDEFDAYVAEHSAFDSWEGFVKAGVREYLLR